MRKVVLTKKTRVVGYSCYLKKKPATRRLKRKSSSQAAGHHDHLETDISYPTVSTHLNFLQMTTLLGQRPLSSPQTRKLKDSLLSARTFSLSRVSLQLGRKICWINRSLLDRHLKALGNLDLNVSVKCYKDIIVNNHIFLSFCSTTF